MRFQGSGFSVELPDGVIDASAYVFTFPQLGELPPNVTVRFELGNSVDMAERLASVQETIRASFPDVELVGGEAVSRRGDWQYFTHIFEFGEDDARIRQKEMHILVPKPKPTYYVLSGTDYARNFANFESTYDQFVLSFQPNEIQRIN